MPEPGGDVPGDHFADDFGFPFPIGNKQNLFRAHNCFDAHGISLGGNVLFLFKEARVSVDGALGEIYDIRALY